MGFLASVRIYCKNIILIKVMSDLNYSNGTISGLYALYCACDGSTYAHVRKAFWRRKFSEEYRNEANRIIKRVRTHSDGFVHVHKGRNVTYGITMNGVLVLKKLGIIP